MILRCYHRARAWRDRKYPARWYRRFYLHLRSTGWANAPEAAHRIANDTAAWVFGPAIWN